MSKIESLIYIDPFSEVILKKDKSQFMLTNSIKKGLPVGSRVGYDDIITYSFKVNNTITEDELDLAVELRMYEDVGLDTSRDYKMVYLKKELDYEDSFIVEVFAIDIEKTRKSIEFTLVKSKRVDYLAVPNICFETLYNNEILEPKKDIFVYIGENEAFVSIYKEGKYLSSSSLDTLNEIVQKIDNNGINIDLDRLKDILKTKGLDKEKYTPEDMQIYESIFTIFSDMFFKINNIAMHNRTIFGFDVIERIFFSTTDNVVFGLKNFVEGLGFGENVELRDFNFFKDDINDNSFEKIVCSFIQDKISSKDNELNLTFIEKRKSLLKTKAGKFLLFFTVCLFAFSSYPIYLLYVNNNLTKSKNSLQMKYQKLQSRSKKIKMAIARKKSEIDKIKKRVEEEKKKIKNIENGIDRLIRMKSDDDKNYQTIITINQILKKYKLHLKSYEQMKNSKITLEIIARYNKRENIARFMQDIIKNGFTAVSTEEIKLDNKRYISKINIAK